MPEAVVALQLQNQASPQLRQTTQDAQALAAALSREALAAGDVNAALGLMGAAVGQTTQETQQSTATSLAAVRAEASLAQALGDRRRAIELLEGAISTENAETAEGYRLSAQITQIENQVTASTQREADAEVRLGQERARAAVAAKDYASAERILAETKTNSAGASAQTIAALDTQIATVETAGTVTGQFGAQLAAFAGPAALIGVAIGTVTKTIQSFSDSLSFVSKLDDTRTAFGGVIGNFAQGNAVLDAATQRTRLFGITEAQTTQAFRDLAPAIRESTATTQQQAEALIRISVLHPEDSANALKTAIEGIETGNIRALSKDLALSTGEQARLKQSVDEGKDSFIALNEVLDRHGITLDVAAKRMDGLAGATRRQQIAEEDLQKTEGRAASGIGVGFAEGKIQLINAEIVALDLLTGKGRAAADAAQASGQSIKDSGDYGSGSAAGWARFAARQQEAAVASQQFTTVTQQQTDVMVAKAAVDDRVASAIQHTTLNMDDERRAAAQLQVQTGQATSDILRSAQASSVDAAQKALQAAQTKLVADQNKAATEAFLALNPNMDASGAIAAAAAQGYSASVGQLAALSIQLQATTADQIAFNNAENAKSVAKTVAVDRFANRSGGRGDSSDATADAAASVAATKAQTAAVEKTLDAEIALAAAKGQTGKQIDLLEQKAQLFGKDSADRMAIEAQIISLQTKGDKSRESSLNKQLTTHESIYDSINKQKDALLDIEELTIQDRQTDRDDAQKIKTANAIIAALAGRTDARSNDLRGRAEDSLALISVQDRQRAQQLAEKGATAGGTIGPNGKLLQSVPGGGVALPPPPGGAGAAGLPPPGAGAGAPSGAFSATINLVVDGKVLATITEPFIMDALLKAVNSKKATVGA